MMQFFTNMQVGTKILVICLLLAVIPTILLGYISYSSSSVVISEQIETLLETQVQEMKGWTNDVYKLTRNKVNSDLNVVVEDSVTTMFLLQTILEDAGFSVMTATDGMNALALLRDHRFDMAVSDVDMPRMNGFLLTEKIRADPSLSKIPVVLVTSLGSAEDRHQGMAVRADAYLVKSSFTTDRFLKIVRHLTEGVR